MADLAPDSNASTPEDRLVFTTRYEGRQGSNGSGSWPGATISHGEALQSGTDRSEAVWPGQAPAWPGRQNAWAPQPAWVTPFPAGQARRLHPAAIAVAVVAAVLVVLVMFAVAIPTFLAARSVSGAAWFNGGAPSGWVPTTVNGLASDEVLEAAWKTPGATVDGFYPCVYVVRVEMAGSAGVSTGTWFAGLASEAASRGWQSQQVVLSDGAPALSVYIAWGAGEDRTASNIPISEYELYARHGTGYYRVTFMTPVQGYTSEITGVQNEIDQFRGDPVGASNLG